MPWKRCRKALTMSPVNTERGKGTLAFRPESRVNT